RAVDQRGAVAGPPTRPPRPGRPRRPPEVRAGEAPAGGAVGTRRPGEGVQRRGLALGQGPAGDPAQPDALGPDHVDDRGPWLVADAPAPLAQEPPQLGLLAREQLGAPTPEARREPAHGQ